MWKILELIDSYGYLTRAGLKRSLTEFLLVVDQRRHGLCDECAWKDPNCLRSWLNWPDTCLQSGQAASHVVSCKRSTKGLKSLKKLLPRQNNSAHPSGQVASKSSTVLPSDEISTNMFPRPRLVCVCTLVYSTNQNCPGHCSRAQLGTLFLNFQIKFCIDSYFVLALLDWGF